MTMGTVARTERDELVYRQVKSGRSLNLGLAAAFAFVAVAAIVIVIGMLVTGRRANAVVAIVAVGLGAAAAASMYWSQYRRYAKALEEIGDDPAGMDTNRSYSRETALIIAGSRRSKDVLTQLVVAYGIIAFVMLAFGVLFLVLLIASSEIEPLFLIAGGVMWVGGLLLTALTVSVIRERAMVVRLEKLE